MAIDEWLGRSHTLHISAKSCTNILNYGRERDKQTVIQAFPGIPIIFLDEETTNNQNNQMKHTEVIERLCILQAEVQQVIGFEHAADCFCGNSGFWASYGYNSATDYRNDGAALAFIEETVRARLQQMKDTSTT